MSKITKRNTVPVTIPVPRSWIPLINRAVDSQDTDRSKFVRSAVRAKLQSHGLNVPSNLA